MFHQRIFKQFFSSLLTERKTYCLMQAYYRLLQFHKIYQISDNVGWRKIFKLIRIKMYYTSYLHRKDRYEYTNHMKESWKQLFFFEVNKYNHQTHKNFGYLGYVCAFISMTRLSTKCTYTLNQKLHSQSIGKNSTPLVTYLYYFSRLHLKQTRLYIYTLKSHLIQYK